MNGPQNNILTQGLDKVHNTFYTHVSDFSVHENMREAMCILNVYYSRNESSLERILWKGPYITDIMLIKVEVEYGRKDVRLYSLWGKWHAILFTRGMDSAVIKMSLEQILIYKISRLYLKGITTSYTFEALRSKVKAYEYIIMETVYLEKEMGINTATVRKVVFQDGKLVCVRHGNVFDRISPNILCKLNDSPSRIWNKKTKKTIKGEYCIVFKDTYSDEYGNKLCFKNIAIQENTKNIKKCLRKSTYKQKQ